ncbi:MAG: GyrI-like domain-containing protein [Mesorhizobium sp.]|nr:GyrI-like domain-containing protein [Mesorhizobium sp.]
MMDKIDFRKLHKALYEPPAGSFVRVDVPPMQFVKIDGVGDPNISPSYKTAVEWLYSVSYALKFAAKAALAKDYVVPPLEGLWWADDPASFVARRKDEWRWTMMVMAPDFIDFAMFEAARAKAARKLGAAPDSLRLESYAEGPSLQTMHVGSYDEEGPVLARLHGEIMPSQGLAFNGPHHEIYLGDPRKTEPARLKTILRQPVKPR